MPYWNAKPAPMPNIGSKYGRKATWIGASGDQTFLRIDEALINSHVLATSEIFASRHIIGKNSPRIFYYNYRIFGERSYSVMQTIEE